MLAITSSMRLVLPGFLFALAAGCDGGSGSMADGGNADMAAVPRDPGALVSVHMDSQVGVLLDEIPASMRERVATDLLAKPDAYWVARAKQQLLLTKYRLSFRPYYYPDAMPVKLSLPLPPDSVWNVAIKPGQNGAKNPARRAKVDNHDVVLVDYSFDSTLLSDATSPGTSEIELDKVGGAWDEPFTFPIDPEHIMQRTGLACMDEAGFPPGSTDPEETAVFFDYACDVEPMTSRTGCHLSGLPTESCQDSLQKHVGHVDTKLHFKRLAWDAAAAAKVRHGDITNKNGADLRAGSDSPIFPPPKVLYRYIDGNSCTLTEKCVGAPGWRRLLEFSSINWNLGTKTMAIGKIDYNLSGMITGPLAMHNVYEFSACHMHYHFMHYGSFTFGDQPTPNSKRGFCLQSTDRLSNNESSPLNQPYWTCDNQGIEAGWADNYNAGIECQWIDVTDVDTSKATVTKKITESINPDQFLCEGTPVLDGMGQQAFEPTTFKTAEGKPVDRPKCDFMTNWQSNNSDSTDFTLPLLGETYVTAACARGQIGPLRNCGFKKEQDMLKCTPGAKVTLSCTLPQGVAPHTVRLCEASRKLGAGLACDYAGALANGVVESTGASTVTFTCPAARDKDETGGLYALYASTLVDGDTLQEVTCK